MVTLGVSGIGDLLALIALVLAVALAVIPPRLLSPWVAACVALLALAHLLG